MASIEKRKTKKGMTYRITVYTGKHDLQGKPVRHRTVYKAEPWLTERQADKNARTYADKFEELLHHGFRVDETVTIREWVDHVLSVKETAGRKKKTISGYRRYAVRVNDAFGNLSVREIHAYDIEAFFEKLTTEKCATAERAIARKEIDWQKLLCQESLSKSELARRAGVSESTVASAISGARIYASKAKSIAEVLQYATEELFTFEAATQTLSARTIEGYYRFLSVIFSAAEREGVITVNPMKHIEPPTFERQEAEVLQPEDLQRVYEAIEQEPLDKKCMIHLLLVTGCRRGELAGLRWSRVIWDEQAVKIDRTIQYTVENGVYEDTTKTRQNRIIRLPHETMALLRELQIWQQHNSYSANPNYKNSDNLFRRRDGGIINPDTISGYVRRFQIKYNLSQIYPHLFRHTMASILYYSGSDPVSISKRLGHAQVSTTQNIYSHLIQQADIDSAEHIADAIFRGKKTK